MKWHEHVCRHPELVIHPLLVWRGKDWLQERRQSLLPLFSRGLSSWSVLAGRTGTRSTAGGVHRRWHDGYEYAKECIGTDDSFFSLIGLQRLVDCQ